MDKLFDSSDPAQRRVMDALREAIADWRTCELCGMSVRSNHIVFDHPHGKLCENCYRTVPAIVWDYAKKRIELGNRPDGLGGIPE